MRSDIDASKIGYFGDSAGGVQGAILPALEKRIKAQVLNAVGLQVSVRHQPEADPFNFIRHVRVPTLMFNGRYDGNFPVETSQRPFFQFLGTPVHDKKHLIYETGHGIPQADLVRESLGWFDKYLGPVRR